MNWGDLGERPFLAEVWGTAAEWIGAIGTTLAAVAAVGIYAWDRRASARTQAQQVIFRDDGEGAYVTIRNMSSLPVFKVKLIWKVARYKPGPDAPRGARRQLQREIAANDISWDVIEAGQGESSLHIHSQPIEIDLRFEPHLVLQDVRGKFWEIPALGRWRSRPKRLRRFRILTPVVLNQLLIKAMMGGALLWYLIRERWRRPKPPAG